VDGRGPRRKNVAELAGVSLPTVDRFVDRYARRGLAGPADASHAAPREQVPAWVAARILALTRATPPVQTGLSHWSSRAISGYLKRVEGISVSWHYVAKLWRERPQAAPAGHLQTVQGSPLRREGRRRGAWTAVNGCRARFAAVIAGLATPPAAKTSQSVGVHIPGQSVRNHSITWAAC
jgi:transposase